MKPQPTLLERLTAKVEVQPSGCWFWTGCRFPNGYGQIRQRRGVATTTHRASWLSHRGNIPPGLQVCHNCDANYPPGDLTYRICVNPDHLFLGTQQDNLDDMVRKGRQNKNKGGRCWNARLTDEQARQILALYAAGRLQSELASTYGVSLAVVNCVVLGRTWRHLGAPQKPIRPRLQPATVLEIRQMGAAGNLSQQEIADRFGVSQTLVSGIVRGKLWPSLLAGEIEP